MSETFSKVGGKRGDKQYLVECDICNGWELFENSGIQMEKFDAKKISEISFTCRHCKADSKQVEFETRLGALEVLLKEGKIDSKQVKFENRLGVLEIQLKEANERVEKVEISLLEISSKVEQTEGKFRDQSSEWCVGKMENEEKLALISNKVDDVESRILALELIFKKKVSEH